MQDFGSNCGKSDKARYYGTMIFLKLGQRYRCRNLAMCTMSQNEKMYFDEAFLKIPGLVGRATEHPEF